MITREQVKAGFEQGIIRLISDPCRHENTVCAIGDDADAWFYFGSLTDAQLTPEEYLRTVPMKSIIDEIYAVLEHFRFNKDLKSDYDSYESVLKEKVEAEKGFDEKAFLAYFQEKFYDDAIDVLCEMLKKVIAYGHKHEQVSKDQFCDWLTEIVPFLSFGEAAMFMEDVCLTESGQAEKKRHRQNFCPTRINNGTSSGRNYRKRNAV